MPFQDEGEPIRSMIVLILTATDDHRPIPPPITELAAHCRWSRPKIYRAFPNGIDDVVAAMCSSFSDDVVQALAREARRQDRPSNFTTMVQAVLDGVGDVLDGDLGKAVLALPRGSLMGEVLDCDSHSLRGRLTTYATRCAAAFHSRLPDDELVGQCELFVTQVLIRVIDSAGEPRTTSVGSLCADLVTSFSRGVEIEAPDRTVSRFVIDMSVSV